MIAEEIEHKAQMISYRILSEVERICNEKVISKKELAEKVGTSPSYITQLFRGTKRMNMEMMARLELALGVQFQVKAVKEKKIIWNNLTPNTL